MRGCEKAREANERINGELGREEIKEAMKKMKESAPGEDGIRMCHLKEACEEVKDALIGMVQFMFEERAHKWDEWLKCEVMCPLFKKGDRRVKAIYREVVLLAMGNRVLARVCAKRMRLWAEHMNLVDENQWGFRKGRSTADVTQVIVRMKEDADDYVKRVGRTSEEAREENDRMDAQLLDMKKEYLRVSKPALWMLLEWYGLKRRILETLIDSHETTEYKVRGKEGMSSAWLPGRGLRQGCSTSPILFNIYHKVVLRQAGRLGRLPGNLRWGSNGDGYQGIRLRGQVGTWERNGSEVKEIRFRELLFADDTTIVGTKEEMDGGVNAMKEVMGKFEERSNDQKEECLDFCMEESDSIRVLGSWVGTKEDVNMRL